MKRRSLRLIIAAVVVYAAVSLALGPLLSNTLKRLILPELEQMTGKKVIAGKIYVNLIPLFVEFKDVKLFDDEGTTIVAADRIKGYVSLTSLFSQEITLKRIVLKRVAVTADREQIEDIAETVRTYLAREPSSSLKVKVRAVVMDDLVLELEDEDIGLKTGPMDCELLLNPKPSLSIDAKAIHLLKEGIPDFPVDIKGQAVIDGANVQIKRMEIKSFGSSIGASGDIGDKGGFHLQTDMDILMDSLKRIFGLQRPGDGNVRVRGSVNAARLIDPFTDISVDLSIDGRLRLETLMELLKVEEPLAGLVTADGTVSGPLNDLKARGTTVITDANIFGVKGDRLSCTVDYGSGVMRFMNGKAALYGGSADVYAQISLPVVNHYRFEVSARNADSKGLFELINWDPGIAAGKVDVEISSEGNTFAPRGRFTYRNSGHGQDIMGRFKVISGNFSMDRNVISLSGLELATEHSTMSAAGFVDLPAKKLSFRGAGKTGDVQELSSPYFSALKGPAAFSLLLSGSLDDPLLTMNFTANSLVLSAPALGLPELLSNASTRFEEAEGALEYRKNLLTLKSLRTRSGDTTMTAEGSVRFPSARQLFDLAKPEYGLNITVKNGSARETGSLFSDLPPLSGTFNAGISLKGPSDGLKAVFTVQGHDVSIDDRFSLGSVEAVVGYEDRLFTFTKFNARRGPFMVSGKGFISSTKEYSVDAAARNVSLFEILPPSTQEQLKDRNLAALTLSDISIKGKGSFRHPVLDLQGTVRYSDPLREQSSGSGTVKASLKSTEAALSASFMGDKIRITGNAALDGAKPWNVKADFISARSDFLVAVLLKEVPEDLLVNLTGTMQFSGNQNSAQGTALFEKAYFFGYGYGMANSRPVSVSLKDQLLTIHSAVFRSEAAEIAASGSVTLGRQFALNFNGTTALAPFRAFSRNIDVLRGSAAVSVSLTGEWDRPSLNGTLDITEGTLGLKGIPHRLTNIYARLRADGDRIMIEKANAKLSGGDVKVSGTGYLDRLSIRRFYLETSARDVSLSVSRNFWVHCDGDLTMQGNDKGQSISGDIRIKKARYTERTDWKSWLLQGRKREKPRTEMTRLDQTGLNVHVVGSNLTVDNNLAKASLAMDIILKGTIGQPAILGRVETRSGVVYFRNNDFTLLRGVVDFSSPTEIKPFFDLLAETRVRSYTIKLALDGYLDKFSMSLSSTPTLDEADIFSLLTVGQIGKNLKGLEGGIGAGEATSFLTGKLQDVVEERLRTVTGVDRFQIDPAISKTAGTTTPRVTLSKRLLGDRLYVSYSTAAGVGEEQIVKLEYLVSKTTSLIGLRDERGGIGADVKFRFEFK